MLTWFYFFISLSHFTCKRTHLRVFFFTRKSKRNLDKHFLFLVFWHSFYNRRLTMMSLHYTTTQIIVWNRCTYISVKGSTFILRERGCLYRRRKSLHFLLNPWLKGMFMKESLSNQKPQFKSLFHSVLKKLPYMLCLASHPMSILYLIIKYT